MFITKISADGEAERQRKRVLLLAYATSPYIGSECSVGWHRAIETAKYFDTWVICDKRFKIDIERYFNEHGNVPGLNFYFIPRTHFEKWIWKIPPKLYRFGYNLWHRRAYRIAVRLHEEFSFDIVHQVNWIGFREPGYLWKLNVPFIWGPVGGYQNYPWRFLIKAGFGGAIVEAARSAVNVLQLHLDTRVRKAAKKAKVVLTSNSTGLRNFQRVYKVKPVILLESGVTSIKSKPSVCDNSTTALKILWSGELKHHKALHLLLHALAKIPHHFRYELRILGKGPLDKRWKSLARRLGIESFCSWMGWMELEDALRQYEWADIFVFTSLRDTTGIVILEALSRGVPLICFDHNGGEDIVTEKCGIKIAVTTPARAILELRNAVVSLAEDRTKVKALSQGAIERAADFLWSKNGERMAELYKTVLNGKINHDQSI